MRVCAVCVQETGWKGVYAPIRELVSAGFPGKL